MATSTTELVLRLKDQVSKNASTIDRHMTQLTRTFQTFRGVANLVGIGIGAGIFGSLIRNAIDAADKIGDLAKQTGFSVETLSGLKTTVEQNGETLENFANSALKALKNLSDAGRGSEQAKKRLADLGFTAQEVTNIMSDPERFLETFAKRLAAVPNHADRARIAMDVMGESGARLLPTLEAIAEQGFDKIRQSSSAMSTASVEAIKDLKDGWTSFKNAVVAGTAIMITDISKLLGLMNMSMIEELGRAQIAADQFTAQVAKDLGKSVQEIEKLSKEELKALSEGFLPSRNILIQGLIRSRELVESLAESLRKAGGEAKGLLGGGEGDPAKQLREIERLEKKVSSFNAPNLSPFGKLEAEAAGLRGEIEKAEIPLTRKKALLAALDEARLGRLRDELKKLQDEANKSADSVEKIIEKLNVQDMDAEIAAIKARGEAEGKAIEERLADEEDFAKRQELNRLNVIKLFQLAAEEEKKIRAQQMAFMVEISERAAENMQDAFADFFNSIGTEAKKAEDIMLGFLDAVRRSINEILATQATNLLFGVPGQGGQRSGGFLQPALSAIGGFLGGFLFHEGGVVGKSPASFRLINASDFAGAQRYHGGGRAGLRPNEVPAILEKGETVIPAGASRMSSDQVVVHNHYNIDARGAAPGMEQNIKRALKETEARAVSRSVKEVQDLRRRGGSFSRTFERR